MLNKTSNEFLLEVKPIIRNILFEMQMKNRGIKIDKKTQKVIEDSKKTLAKNLQILDHYFLLEEILDISLFYEVYKLDIVPSLDTFIANKHGLKKEDFYREIRNAVIHNGIEFSQTEILFYYDENNRNKFLKFPMKQASEILQDISFQIRRYHFFIKDIYQKHPKIKDIRENGKRKIYNNLKDGKNIEGLHAPESPITFKGNMSNSDKLIYILIFATDFFDREEEKRLSILFEMFYPFRDDLGFVSDNLDIVRKNLDKLIITKEGDGTHSLQFMDKDKSGINERLVIDTISTLLKERAYKG